MSNKLCDLSVVDLRRILRATERSVGRNSVSAKIIRRELEKKQLQLRQEKGVEDAK
jgi:hypothetical protein